MTTQLTVTHLAGSTLAGRTQTFARTRLLLGRRPDNDVVFDAERDRKVSGYHAEVWVEAGALRVTDKGSQNGTYVNGRRIEGVAALEAGAVLRLGDDGPELRITGEGLATAAAPAPAGGGKQGIGAATLDRAIQAAVRRERSSTRGKLLLVLLVLLGALGAGGYAYWQGQQKQKELEDQMAAAGRAMDELRARSERQLGDALAAHEQQLKALEGTLGAGEARISRLIVEIQERDRALEQLKQRQDLTDEDRRKMVAELEGKVSGLHRQLEQSQREAREVAARAGGEGWADLVQRYEQGLFLVVFITAEGEFRGTGTAFCLREDGLLATNAHVVAVALQCPASKVVQNGTGRVFPIRRAIGHPGFSTPNSPDIGLIQADVPAGTRFPALPLASDEELKKLRVGSHLGTIGYPGELQGEYFATAEQVGDEVRLKSAVATFKDGWVGRMLDYTGSAADFARSTFIQHSASLSGGTSGSPMFTTDGKVVAVNNSGRDNFVLVQSQTEPGAAAVERTPSAAEIGFAIRADELRRFWQQTGW